MNEHDSLQERVASAIETLLACAEEHKKVKAECPNCHSGSNFEYRCKLTADLMSALGLELSDIGFVADEWMENFFAKDEPPDPDAVLDANEIQ